METMKAFFLLFVINIVATKCAVMNFTKNSDRVEKLPQTKTGVRKHESYKTFNINESHIYLDDVLFALKNQNWTDDEKPCLDRTLLLLRSLQNFTLWAVWDWDSISSEPVGLLYGNRFQLGNFDECMRAPWYKRQPELRTQYCLSDIVLERTDKAVKKAISDPFNPYESALNVIEYQSVYRRPLNQLTWGVCVPAVCQPRSVEKLTGVLLAHSHLGAVGLRARISVQEKCQKADEPLPYDNLFYGFMGATAFLVAVTLICTYMKYKKKQMDENDIKDEIITAFDLQSNASNLLTKSEGGTDVIYGIKFLSMCIIVSGHQYGIFNGGPVSNGLKVDEDASSVIGMMVLHEDVVVDSFFLLSGFLTATSLTKLRRIPNILVMFFKRYCRLMVTYAVVIFYICAVYPHVGSGPLWNRAIAEETEPCRKNWWLNFLMVSNYVDSQHMCLVPSWYIPCDYHFFVVTVGLYWLYKRRPALGRVVAALVFVAAIVTPGVINYLNTLPAIQLFTYDFVSNPRGPKQFHLTYIKSHTRYASYLIGFLSGYVFTHISVSQKLKSVAQKWSIPGAVLSIIVMGVIAFTGSIFLWRTYDVLESAVYAALNRPVWACGLALFILCCSLGHVPIINGFLRWYPWVPLSKLTYGLYLIHTLLIARNVYVTRNSQHHDYFNSMTSCFGIIFEGTVMAFLIRLFAEAPLLNLLNISLRPRKRQSVEKQVDPQSHTSKVNERMPSGNGHFEDNLPSTIQVISSKM